MNPFLGLLIIAIGSTSAASFYVPLNKVKNWAWETFYLSHGVIAWIITPLIAALFATPRLFQVYKNSPLQVIAATSALGVLWGVGACMPGPCNSLPKQALRLPCDPMVDNRKG